MGTEFLTIILLWCNGSSSSNRQIEKCREEKIACVRKLKNFTTDDVIDKCLQPDGAK